MTADKTIDNDFVKKIFVRAFVLRFIVLSLIFVFTPDMTDGFVSNSFLENDDVRYELGGLIYARTAHSLFDQTAFATAYGSLGDWVGYRSINPFSSTSLWYWIICIILFFTNNILFTRLFNIFLASVACVFLYKFAAYAYNDKIAKNAAKLLAYLPYPVVFSCFAYKDHLVMCLTFYLLFKAVQYSKDGIKWYIYDWFLVLLSASALLMLRSGLPIILFIVCFTIMYYKKLLKLKLNLNTIILVFSLFVVLSFLLYNFLDVILYKFDSYILQRANIVQDGSISYLTVNGIGDFYKIPIAYLFSVVMPIGLNGKIDTWANIIANINILMVVVSVGSFLIIFRKNKINKCVYWLTLIYYLISIVASLGIFRHYFSLIPISYIAFSEFLLYKNKIEAITLYSFATIYSFAIVVYYGFLR